MAQDATSDNTLPGFGGGLSNIGNLSTIRQIGILVGIAASVALGIIVALWTREPPMRPLPANDRQTTFEIIQFLDQQKVPYVLDSDGVVNVPLEHFQKVQLQLSAQGVLNNESAVDNLLAKDTGFAVSQRLEQARLMRMQEIKLARTIEKFTGIKAAEVHLAIPKETVFLRDTDKPRASVLLNLYGPRTLDAEQIRAMVDLVVGSVPDLDESRVTITDQFGRLHHSGSQTKDEIAASKEFAESRKREAELQSKIDRVLTPIIGAGKYTVEVHVDMDFSETEQTQKLYNADLPAVSSERTLSEQNNSGGGGGVPGALSNQPPAPATAPQIAGSSQTAATAGAAGASGSSRSEAERQFEHDTTIAHTRNQVGQIRRVTVSVGLDYIDKPATPAPANPDPAAAAAPASGPERVAHSKDDVASITKLVQSAIGYDLQRGDVVEIQSFPFVAVTVPEAAAATPVYELPWFQELAKYGVAAIGIILFMLMVVRPLMRWLLAGEQNDAGGALRGMPDLPGMPGMAGDQLSLSGATASMSLPPPVTTELDTVVRARSVVQTDPALVANVVKNWMERDA